jgi:hypothetical protein
MDDFIILHPDKRYLREVLASLHQYVNQNLRLELHFKKTNIHPFCDYERFVGYELGLYHRRLARPTVQRFRRRYKRLQLRDPAAADDSLA